MLALLCTFSTPSLADGGYRGVDVETPMFWEVSRIGNRSYAFSRRFNGPGGARVDMHARQATAVDEAAMRDPRRGSGAMPLAPGWSVELVLVAHGYAVLQRKGDQYRAHARVLVKDRKGSSLVTFEGAWPSKVHLLVGMAADSVLEDIHNL